jgi:hypothetical protein
VITCVQFVIQRVIDLCVLYYRCSKLGTSGTSLRLSWLLQAFSLSVGSNLNYGVVYLSVCYVGLKVNVVRSTLHQLSWLLQVFDLSNHRCSDFGGVLLYLGQFTTVFL